ncbi:hypothetical protein MPTP_1933 (plasmid) [Melissococcus plutonius ATCC 35311]|uniref:Uncharacterized protein n=1 Tax=Melissococcus plutonius (strain ATCC 35311 / DSM 29964 / CIP 104052 / LMG 20360 / NCIMB 702443) TaxID=940190 RepID=F3YCU5_MELPT|nr:putative peptide zinc metalloprotease protein [Melissococcus plutonius]BAK22323.1 hypothetical protein MPTP_1933 [Melissococcus plutonius ATCC 35311]
MYRLFEINLSTKYIFKYFYNWIVFIMLFQFLFLPLFQNNFFEIVRLSYKLDYVQIIFILYFTWNRACSLVKKKDIKQLKFGFALVLNILPTFYIKHKVYNFTKIEKITYYLSGCLMNIFIVFSALIYQLVFGVSNVSSCFILINFSIVFLNLIPFLITDGYHILTIITDEYNLRQKFTSVIKNPVNLKNYNKFVKVYTIFNIIFLFFINVNTYTRITNVTNSYVGMGALLIITILQVLLFRR